MLISSPWYSHRPGPADAMPECCPRQQSSYITSTSYAHHHLRCQHLSIQMERFDLTAAADLAACNEGMLASERGLHVTTTMRIL